MLTATIDNRLGHSLIDLGLAVVVRSCQSYNCSHYKSIERGITMNSVNLYRSIKSLPPDQDFGAEFMQHSMKGTERIQALLLPSEYIIKTWDKSGKVQTESKMMSKYEAQGFEVSSLGSRLDNMIEADVMKPNSVLKEHLKPSAFKFLESIVKVSSS